ncbi:MAG: biopolymer transporter ExbD [Acidobacteriota bacterium]|nr:biopolymer transporter ExbD [Acidobacteriota bacterium]
MAFKHKERMIEAVIPTASMADIAFLLIIFFMVTTQFQLDRTAVSVPKSEIRAEVPKGSAYVVIYKLEDLNQYAYKFTDGEIQSRPVPDVSTMEIEINTVASIDQTRPFVIKAPGEAPYRLIDEIIEMLRRAGVEEIILLTDQRTVDDVS